MPVEHLSPKKSVVAEEKTLDPDKIAANQPHTSLRLRLGHQEGRGSLSSLHDFRGSHVQKHTFGKSVHHTKKWGPMKVCVAGKLCVCRHVRGGRLGPGAGEGGNARATLCYRPHADAHFHRLALFFVMHTFFENVVLDAAPSEIMEGGR